MNLDPLGYIFGIIKYVKDHHILKYDPVIKAIGSCVRTILRKEEYTNILLVISSEFIVNEFIKLLKVFEILKCHEDMRKKTLFPYIKLCITYNNKVYTIYVIDSISDISNFCDKNIHFIRNFGLTCDNLIIDIDGNISTIISHHRINKHSSLTWAPSCIQDAINGQFRVILLENMNTFDKIEEYNNICQDMINSGFTFDKENSKNLTSFQFIELKSHNNLIKYCNNREISTNCSICQEKYEDEPDNKTILIVCLHDFHIKCLKNWIITNKNSCPICRNEIMYDF